LRRQKAFKRWGYWIFLEGDWGVMCRGLEKEDDKCGQGTGVGVNV